MISGVNLVIRVVVNALALAVAAWIFDGIKVKGHDATGQALTLLAVGIVFGLVNAVVAPVVKLLSLPFIIVTLGLFLLVVNALMLLLTSRICEALDLGFRVDGFWTAVGGAIVISIAGALFGAVLDDD